MASMALPNTAPAACGPRGHRGWAGGLQQVSVPAEVTGDARWGWCRHSGGRDTPAHGSPSLVVLSAQVAMVSERLHSVLGLSEDVGSDEEALVQLSIQAPELQPREQRVSVGDNVRVSFEFGIVCMQTLHWEEGMGRCADPVLH